MGKITLTNIAEELAAKSGLDKETADNFVRAFVETIEQGLNADNLVKIKGLGTFKLLDVSDRESVDVNTGERITIKGHTKVTFTPDSAMKEFVNRPFAHFEPTELNEGYPAEEEPSSIDEVELTNVEVENMTTEISDAPTETVEETKEAVVESDDKPSDLQAPLEEVVEEVLKEDMELPTPEESIASENSTSESNSPEDTSSSVTDSAQAEEVEHVKATEPDVEPIGESVVQPTSQEKRSHRGGWFLVILLIALAGGIYYYMSVDTVSGEGDNSVEQGCIMVNPNLEQELGKEWGVDSVENRQPTLLVADTIVADTVKCLEEKTPIDDTPECLPVETKPIDIASENKAEVKSGALVIVESLASKSLKDVTPADTTDYIIAGTQTIHELQDGETIISLSRKYYGDKRLWPYIVKHNNIVDFNKVAVGMVINIPKLEAKTGI